jgi:hypothetical protein
MDNLSKQDLLSIGIKLLALYVFLQCLQSTAWIVTIVSSRQVAPDSFSFTVLMLLIGYTVAFLVWVLSDRIAKWAVKSNHTVTISSEATNSLQSTLFCSVGLFIFLTSFPELIQQIILALVVLHSNSQSSPLPMMIVQRIDLLFRVGLSIVVMFKSKGLATLIYKLRYGGAKDKDLKP